MGGSHFNRGGYNILDVQGYNYADPDAEAFHKTNPKAPVMGTEQVSAWLRAGSTSWTPTVATSAPTIRGPQTGALPAKGGGPSATRGRGWLAGLSGRASTTAASRRLTAGPTSARSTALSTRADFPKTASSTSSPGGPRSLYCTYSRTGIGRVWKARRSPSGSIRTWTEWNCSVMARALARRP